MIDMVRYGHVILSFKEPITNSLYMGLVSRSHIPEPFENMIFAQFHFVWARSDLIIIEIILGSAF